MGVHWARFPLIAFLHLEALHRLPLYRLKRWNTALFRGLLITA